MERAKKKNKTTPNTKRKAIGSRNVKKKNKTKQHRRTDRGQGEGVAYRGTPLAAAAAAAEAAAAAAAEAAAEDAALRCGLIGCGLTEWQRFATGDLERMRSSFVLLFVALALVAAAVDAGQPYSNEVNPTSS